MTTNIHLSTPTVVLAIIAFVVAGSSVVALATLTFFLMERSMLVAVTPPAMLDTGMLMTTVPTSIHLSSPQPILNSTIIRQPTPLAWTATLSATLLPIAPPLIDPALSLFSGPVDVPLEIQIPALKIKAPVLGVGLTSTNTMASPLGSYADDPIWQTVFWYRGGGIPGNIGTTTLAGHYDDTLGRPAVFAYLDNLQVGSLIILRNTRSGSDIPFIVTETKFYTNQEAADPTVLARVFGSSSESDAKLQTMSDQLSHLTLITCGGAWVHGSFDLRLVVYAIRASYPLQVGE